MIEKMRQLKISMSIFSKNFLIKHFTLQNVIIRLSEAERKIRAFEFNHSNNIDNSTFVCVVLFAILFALGIHCFRISLRVVYSLLLFSSYIQEKQKKIAHA